MAAAVTLHLFMRTKKVIEAMARVSLDLTPCLSPSPVWEKQ